MILSLYAPYMPFITEELYGRIYAETEEKTSIHVTEWPKADPSCADASAEKEMEAVIGILDGVRFLRTQNRDAGKFKKLTIETDAANSEAAGVVQRNQRAIMAAARCDEILTGNATHQTCHPGIKVRIHDEGTTALKTAAGKEFKKVISSTGV
jgi:valyl-tRNA synthetase